MTKPQVVLAALVAVVVAMPAVSLAQQQQAVHLSDGDSFRIGDRRYRLHGIDAPELHQECKDSNGRNWPCGRRARSELRRLIGNHPLECQTMATDRFGRIVATCKAGGRDLAEEMVRGGYATVFARQGFVSPYEPAQQQARAEKRGMWAGSFEVPGDWRRANPREDAPAGGFDAREWVARKATQAWQWLQATIGR
jgi:endonuclease YncB( thermonuclease family)